MIQKVSFKDIYLPVKNGIIGNIWKAEHKTFNDLYNSLNVTYHPDKPIGKWCISAVYFNKGQAKRLFYGKTIKEIKALIKDMNDFIFDPHLFLNQ